MKIELEKVSDVDPNLELELEQRLCPCAEQLWDSTGTCAVSTPFHLGQPM